MSYSVHITCTTPEVLAEIEQGNPKRRFKTATLHHAVALVNAVRFASGAGMTRGPDKLAAGHVWLSTTDTFRLEVIRHVS